MNKHYIVPITTSIPVSMLLLSASIRRIENAPGLQWGGGTTSNGITSGNARYSDFWEDMDPEDFDADDFD